ncbi:MAG TPA: hypothetical protein VNH46_07840, partial [Gemmatimonadales bacterium]|nr:hypothetical protein [Gemmatimonadales bacterium]
PASWQYTRLSDSVTVSATNPYLAVSRDGQSVVFRESRPGGSLWIKRAGQLSATPIPGTERARGPTFSPDGDWIAFLADGQVKKVGLVAGSPIIVADSAPPGDGYNVAWLDDGTLVYPPPRADELYRMSASGGARTVALADSTLRGYGLQHLQPLPHARGVLFTSCGSGCVPSSLHVLDLRTGRQKLLLNDMLSAWYLPTGQLLYVRRDGTALAAPFDLDRLEITGPGVPVLDRILLTGLVAGLAVSPSGTLVYLTGGDAAADVEFVRVNRAGTAVPVDTTWFGSFNSSALSPDGRRLAVGLGRTAGAFAIWTKQLDHGPFSRLTFGGRDRRPAWSPDGRMVAFIRDSGNGGSVYGRAADGSGSDRLLARLDRPVQEVEWSPDGRWLLLRTDNGTAGAGDVLGVRLSGDTTPVPLLATPFSELEPALSPDTKWLAYSSNESGAEEVYVRPFPGTASGGRWQISTAGGSQPRWSPDGRQLFFMDGAGRLIAAEVRASPGFGVLQRQPLFDVRDYIIDPFHQSYEVMPDGKSFLFLRSHQGAMPIEPRTVLVRHWFTDLRARTRS